MSFTGEVIHGWRIADRTRRRRVWFGPANAFAWVDEPIYEVIKGQRHIRATGQDGIDPQVVLGRAVIAGLTDDLRQAKEDGKDLEVLMHITDALDKHERQLKVYENGWIARRLIHKHGMAATFRISPAGAGAKGKG